MVMARKHLISLISNCYKTGEWKTESVHLFPIEKSAGLRLVHSSTSCTHVRAHTWLNETRRQQWPYGCDKSFTFSSPRDTDNSGQSVKTQIESCFAGSLVYLATVFVYLFTFLLHISSWLAFANEVELPRAGQFRMLVLLQRVW